MLTRRSFGQWLAGAGFSCLFPSLISPDEEVLIADVWVRDPCGPEEGFQNCVFVLDGDGSVMHQFDDGQSWLEWDRDMGPPVYTDKVLHNLMVEAQKKLVLRPPLQAPG